MRLGNPNLAADGTKNLDGNMFGVLKLHADRNCGQQSDISVFQIRKKKESVTKRGRPDQGLVEVEADDKFSAT